VLQQVITTPVRFGLMTIIVASACSLPLLAAGQTSTPRVLYVSTSAGFAHESRIHAGQFYSGFALPQSDSRRGCKLRRTWSMSHHRY